MKAELYILWIVLLNRTRATSSCVVTLELSL